jgi:HSP20 family protein
MAERTDREQTQRSEQERSGGTRTPSQRAMTPRRSGGGLATRRGAGGLDLMNPFDMMQRFSDQMDRLFSDFGLRPRIGRGQSGEVSGSSDFGTDLWMPQVEMLERNGKLIVRAELPGLEKDDVDVEIEDDVLTLQGNRRHESEEERDGIWHSERSYGHFYRSIPLPEGTDSESAEANFHNGVLEITMTAPKQQERRSRRLTIGEGQRTMESGSSGQNRSGQTPHEPRNENRS